VAGEVKKPILSDDASLDSYRLPWELLDQADFSKVDAFCAKSDNFVRPGAQARPFERLQFLRGTEQTLVDLAYQPVEKVLLTDMV
jgi:hypothetical protein